MRAQSVSRVWLSPNSGVWTHSSTSRRLSLPFWEAPINASCWSKCGPGQKRWERLSWLTKKHPRPLSIFREHNGWMHQRGGQPHSASQLSTLVVVVVVVVVCVCVYLCGYLYVSEWGWGATYPSAFHSPWNCAVRLVVNGFFWVGWCWGIYYC